LTQLRLAAKHGRVIGVGSNWVIIGFWDVYNKDNVEERSDITSFSDASYITLANGTYISYVLENVDSKLT